MSSVLKELFRCWVLVSNNFDIIMHLGWLSFPDLKLLFPVISFDVDKKREGPLVPLVVETK